MIGIKYENPYTGIDYEYTPGEYISDMSLEELQVWLSAVEEHVLQNEIDIADLQIMLDEIGPSEQLVDALTYLKYKHELLHNNDYEYMVYDSFVNLNYLESYGMEYDDEKFIFQSKPQASTTLISEPFVIDEPTNTLYLRLDYEGDSNNVYCHILADGSWESVNFHNHAVLPTPETEFAVRIYVPPKEGFVLKSYALFLNRVN